MEQGNIVLINGTSSAGKSSTARALQEIMETPYLHTGVDHFLPRFPARLFDVTSPDAPASTDYFQLLYRDGARRIVVGREGGDAVYGDGTLIGVRLGPSALHLFAGIYRAIAALARSGIDVVVDDVIYDHRVLQAAVAALHDVPVLFVGLRLPREVADRRERERGDRGPGGAAAFYDLVHAHGVYDLEFDTATTTAVECARRIKEALENAHPRRAFPSLYRAFGL
jgi:chloramphenicol 3-O phosphotransferase